jgi:hypothetical protein
MTLACVVVVVVLTRLRLAKDSIHFRVLGGRILVDHEGPELAVVARVA